MPQPPCNREATPCATTLIVCLGNEFRGDDGFGLLVAEHLGGRVGHAKVIAHHGDALALSDAWRGFDRVIFVDAIAAPEPPGTIRGFDLRSSSAPLELGGTSTHARGPGGVVEMARALDELPARIDV